MKPVFYTTMNLDHGTTLADICRTAHTLGYEMVPFAGYSNSDLGYSSNRGPRWNEARANQALINEILSTHGSQCYCSIFQCPEETGRV